MVRPAVLRKFNRIEAIRSGGQGWCGPARETGRVQAKKKRAGLKGRARLREKVAAISGRLARGRE